MKATKKITALTLFVLMPTVLLLTSCQSRSGNGIPNADTSFLTQQSTAYISTSFTAPVITTTEPSTAATTTVEFSTTPATSKRQPTAAPTTIHFVAPSPSSAAKNAAKYNVEVMQSVSLLNEHRADNDIAPLELDNDLTVAACIRALEMAKVDDLSHTRPDGTSCFTVFDDAGINCSGANGENIASGQTSPQSAFDSWHNSPGHDKNMLNSKYNKIGIGVATTKEGKPYWVQLFAASVEPINEQ